MDGTMTAMRTLVRRGSAHPAPRFVLVGAVSVATDFAVLAGLHGGLMLGLGYAVVLAYLVAFAVNFTLSRRWTFDGATEGDRARQLARYIGLVALNLVLTYVFVTGLADLGLNYLVAKLLVASCLAVGNFFAYRHLVFI
jgi:putative flippase GtrA